MPKTGFVHNVDGFAFNNHWGDMQPGDWDQIRGVIQDAATAISFHPLAAPAVLAVPPGPPLSNVIVARIVADQIVSNVQPGSLGLCGGMAFAAADYYALSWLPPRGEFSTAPAARNPGWVAPAEATLRRYLWGRLLESLGDGKVAVNTLIWMGVVHDVFPFSTFGGAQWLRDRSREAFREVKAAVDGGRVQPIALIGNTSNPTHNHQVLVTGYDDPGPWGAGTCRLYVYEPNDANVEHTIDVDFSGARPPEESAYPGGYSEVRGRLQGFFTASYAPRQPPPALVVTAGLDASVAPTVSAGALEEFTMTVKNVGFGDTPPIKLFVAGRAGADNVDPGGESRAARIAMGDRRTITQATTIEAPPGPRRYFASTSVEPDGSHQAWRLPSAAEVGRTSVDLAVDAEGGPWASAGGILTSPPAVFRSPDHRLHVFALGATGNLFVLPQTAPNGPWPAWRPCGDPTPGGLRGRPFAMVDGGGLMHIFCRGADGQVWHLGQGSTGASLTAWDRLGGGTLFDPSASFDASGAIEVVVRQNDGAVARRRRTPEGWAPRAGGWESRGGDLSGGPALARNADGRLEVFARFSDNGVRHMWQSPRGDWSEWHPFGIDATGDISVGVNSDGRLEAFCVSQGTVWHRWQSAPSNGWSEWADTQQHAARDARIAVVKNSFGGIEAFVRAPDDAIWTAGFRRRGAPWAAWRSLHGAADGDPAAGVNADGRIMVFVRGRDRSLQYRTQVVPGDWG